MVLEALKCSSWTVSSDRSVRNLECGSGRLGLVGFGGWFLRYLDGVWYLLLFGASAGFSSFGCLGDNRCKGGDRGN